MPARQPVLRSYRFQHAFLINWTLPIRNTLIIIGNTIEHNTMQLLIIMHLSRANLWSFRIQHPPPPESNPRLTTGDHRDWCQTHLGIESGKQRNPWRRGLLHLQTPSVIVIILNNCSIDLYPCPFVSLSAYLSVYLFVSSACLSVCQT